MKKPIIFIICLAIVFSAGLISSLANTNTTSPQWYLDNKPDITPPGFIFPIVLNILYFLITISLFIVWTKSKKKDKKKIAMIFVAKDIDKKAAWLLIPYFLWVTFASFLNYGFLV